MLWIQNYVYTCDDLLGMLHHGDVLSPPSGCKQSLVTANCFDFLLNFFFFFCKKKTKKLKMYMAISNFNDCKEEKL